MLLRTDAAASVGVGHAMRMLALAQELTERSIECIYVGEMSVSWVARAYAESGIDVVDAPADATGLVSLAQTLGARAVVLDRYTLGPSYGEALRHAGIRTLALVDGPFGGDQIADIFLDQNPGAQAHPTSGDEVALAGGRYTLFRNNVLAARRDAAQLPLTNPTEGPLRVLAVFGGTDPFGAAAVVGPLILQTGSPVELTLVRPEGSKPLNLQAGPGQVVHEVPPLSDLAASAREADFVVSAAGTSVLELMCMGVPLGIVCVVDNQVPGYIELTAGFATGVGILTQLVDDADARTRSVAALREVLSDAASRRETAIRGQQLLDGRGRERVADALVGIQVA